MPVIPTFWRLRHYCEFKASLYSEFYANRAIPPPKKKSHHECLALTEGPQLAVLFRILGALPFGVCPEPLVRDPLEDKWNRFCQLSHLGGWEGLARA